MFRFVPAVFATAVTGAVALSIFTGTAHADERTSTNVTQNSHMSYGSSAPLSAEHADKTYEQMEESGTEAAIRIVTNKIKRRNGD